LRSPSLDTITTAVRLAPAPTLTGRWGGGAMALSLPGDAHLRDLRKLIKSELIKVCSARHEVKLDQPALELLKRLANSDGRAVQTLAQLENWCERKGRASCWRNIVLACVDAERQAREFPKHIEEANEVLDRLEQPREALAVLRRFLCKNKNKNWAVLWGNSAAIERGLDLLDYGIGTEERVAKEAFAQFGATRKTKIKVAPRGAAIWALVEAVKHYTGKPHYGEVASLASVIFRTTIDENIVKHGVRERAPRFDAMQKKRAERLLDLTTDFGRIREGRN
jgi:hypothetical protein